MRQVPAKVMDKGTDSLVISADLAVPLDAATSTFGLLGIRGSGKLLTLDTRIPTPDGWTTMGELQVGDRVIGRDGKPCNVVYTSEVDPQPELFDLHLSDGQVISACADHQWVVRDSIAARNARSKKRKAAIAHCARLDSVAQVLGIMSDEVNPDLHETRNEILARVGDMPDFPWSKPRTIGLVLDRNDCPSIDGSSRGLRRTTTLYPVSIALKTLASAVQRTAQPVAQSEQRVMTTRQLIQGAAAYESRFSIPTAAPLELPEATLKIDPYVMGVWLGDGATDSGSVTVGSTDLATMTTLLSDAWGANLSAYETRPNAFRIVLHVPNPDLCAYGHADWYRYPAGRKVCPSCNRDGERTNGKWNVSLTTQLAASGMHRRKHIPVPYLRASASQRLSLLQGLMDADGTVSSEGYLELSLCDERLARDALELIRSLGIKVAMTTSSATITEDDPDNPGQKRSRVTGRRWRMTFTTGTPVFRLPRKLERLPKIIRANHHQRHYITAITPVATRPGKCIQVDSADHTYLAAGFVPTHNTTAAAVLCEELLEQHIPVAIIDPTGAHWGLRSSASGKKAGYPVVIFGGEHADVPLEPGSGELVANLLVTERIPAILDLSLMRKTHMRDWVADFLETLYRRNREALHVVIDESNLFAPQRTFQGSERVLGAVEDTVMRGRIRGLGISLISQRAASLNKSVLTQVETLILLRTTGRPDITAIDEWIANHADLEQGRTVKASLASLPTGTAWVWSPHFLGVLQKVAIRARRTFDSSATPKAGQVRITPERWANIDIAALGERVQAAVETAKATDPKALRARVAKLERTLVEREATITQLRSAAEGGQADLEAALARRDNLIERLREKLATRPSIDDAVLGKSEAAVRVLTELHTALRAIADGSHNHGDAPLELPAAPRRVITPTPSAVQQPGPRPVPPIPGQESAPQKLSKAQRAILSALAPYAPRTRTKRQVAMLAGYAGNGGGFNNAISSLRTAGYLEGGSAGMRATEAGLEALGDYDPLPSGQELLDYWLGQLPKAPRLILGTLAKAWPDSMSKEEVAAHSDYEPGGGGFNNAISRLRTLELITGTGAALRAAEELMEVAG